MTGKQKLAQAVKHFDAIRKLYPDSHCASLTIHRMRLKDINLKDWEQKGTVDSTECYKRKPFPGMRKFFDIILFIKKEDN